MWDSEEAILLFISIMFGTEFSGDSTCEGFVYRVFVFLGVAFLRFG